MAAASSSSFTLLHVTKRSVVAGVRSSSQWHVARATSTSAKPSSPPYSSSSSATSDADINVSLVLSRQPIVLREPSPFERSFFHYNYNMSRRLAQPFFQEFYFRKGSAAEARFGHEEKHRKATIDSEGKSTASSEAPPPPSVEEAGVDAELYATRPRTTEADARNDLTSLERALDRTLFLVMRSPSSESIKWRLPTTKVDLVAGETLHKVATRPVEAALGNKMDIWIVSNLPIGVLPRPSEAHLAPDFRTAAAKTYFLRAHVLSGLPWASSDTEFAWLTQEEIQNQLISAGDAEYYRNIRDLLSQ